MDSKSSTFDKFADWLEKELRLRGKISMSEAITAGAEKFKCTIDTAGKYLSKVLMLKSGHIKLNLDESKGIKFLEIRKDFHYTGDRKEYEDFKGTEDIPPEEEDSEKKNIYGMKHEGKKYDSDKDSKEDKDSEPGKYSPGDLEKEE